MMPKEHELTDAEREANEIALKARRKEEALRHRTQSPWSGLRMFGLVGWAVAVPTVLGIALGLWIDAETDTEISWTLALLLAGVTVGCLNAWYWVQRELHDD